MIILILSALFVSGFTGLIFVKYYYPEYDVLRFNRISASQKNGTSLITGSQQTNQSTGTALVLKGNSSTKKKEFQRTPPKINRAFVENYWEAPSKSTLFRSFSSQEGTKAYRLHSGPSAFKPVNNINNFTALSLRVITQHSFSPILIILPCLILFAVVIALYLIRRLFDHFSEKETKSREKVSNETVEESVALAPSQAERPLPSASLHESSDTRALEDLTTLVQENVPLPHRFINKTKIGEGGFGQVYKALDWTTNKMVAIKVITPKQKISTKKLIPREVKLLRKLRHDNIVTLYNYYPDGDSFNIVMELVSGGNIEQFLQTGPLAENYVSCIAKQVLTGLEYLHSLEIVHGDIKPLNILYTLSGKIKIADFGLSLTLKDLRKYNYMREGTPFYVAPEIVSLQPHGVKVDVWAVGITLIELLQGETPGARLNVFGARRANSCLGVRLLNEPEWYSEEAVDFLKNTLMRVPKHRWHSHMLLKHQFVKNAPPPAALIPLIIQVRNLRKN